MPVTLVLSTYPDMDAAAAAARDIVGSKLAACVNMVSARSIYSWKGEIHDDGEIIVIFKTVPECIEKLRKAIRGSHPYDVPELVEIDAESSGTYMEWITEYLRS